MLPKRLAVVLSGLPSQPQTGRGLQTKILELKMLLHRSIIYRHVQVDAQHDFLLPGAPPS